MDHSKLIRKRMKMSIYIMFYWLILFYGTLQPFNVLRYEIGQRYASHYDAFDPAQYGPQKNQRVCCSSACVLLNLNIYCDAQIEFNYLKKTGIKKCLLLITCSFAPHLSYICLSAGFLFCLCLWFRRITRKLNFHKCILI